MDDAVRKILAKRRDRSIATILGAKEDLADPYMSQEDSAELRKVVLDVLNDYYDLCSDLLKSVQPDGMVMNETWLDKIDDIHEAVIGGR